MADIFNFPNLHQEAIEIENYTLGLTENLAALNELPEWTILFLSLLGKGSYVGISKKGYTYTSYPPEKKYLIYIPIPTNEDIIWGIKKKDFVRKHLDENKLMDKVEGIEFSHFDSLSGYIIESSKKGIEQLLKKGISLKGVKIKI